MPVRQVGSFPKIGVITSARVMVAQSQEQPASGEASRQRQRVVIFALLVMTVSRRNVNDP